MRSADPLVIPGAGDLPDPLVTAPIPSHSLVWGGVRPSTSAPLVAGEPCDLEIEIALTEAVSPGHSIEAWMHFVCDVPRQQTDDPAGRNYFGCCRDGEFPTYSHPGVPIHGAGRFFPYRRCCGVELPDGADEGQVIPLLFSGMEAQTYADRLFNIRFTVMDGDDLVGYLGDAGWPVVGGAPDHLRVTAPTLVATGEEFEVRILVCDRFGNPAGRGLDRRELRVECDGLHHGPPAAADGHGLAFRLPGARFEAEGAHYIRISGEVAGLSNPVVARAQVPERILWGDPHQHTYLADGRARPAASYAYGRHVAHLDFGAVTPHIVHTFRPPLLYTSAEPQEGWPEVAEATADADGGEFSALLGYEGSLRQHTGDQDVLLSDLEATPVEVRLGRGVENYEEFLEECRSMGGELMLLPHAHAGGGPGRYEMPDLGELQPSVEVTSVHGIFIEYLHHYLRRGYRVGLHGGGDNHMPAMGNAFPGKHYCNTNGLTAALAPENGRRAIWNAFRDRRTYAVSANQRIYLDFRIGEVAMGGLVEEDGQLPVEVEVAGTRPILRVDLVKNCEVLRTWRPEPGGESLLRLMWWDEWPERRTDDSRTVGTVELAGGKPEPLEPLNLLNREEFIRPTEDGISFRTCAYSWTPRGALLPAPKDAKAARLRVHDERRGSTLLDTTLELPLDRRHSEEAAKLEADESMLRPEYVPQIIVPAFHAAADRVSLDWSRTAEVRWQEKVRPGDYYYVRVEQVDGACAWSSPIWIE